MQNPLSLRQQEFCRRYAAGLPAAKAALAAGYAQSTAETNAARLLAHPLCAEYIARLRQHMALVSPENLRAVATHLFTIATTVAEDPRPAIAAAEQLRRLAVVCPHLALVPLADKTPTTHPQTRVETPADTRQNPDTDTAQQTVNQIDTPSDTDTLPDGTAAFDHRILPTRPAPPKPKPTPIVVRFMSLIHKPRPQDTHHKPPVPSSQDHTRRLPA